MTIGPSTTVQSDYNGGMTRLPSCTVVHLSGVVRSRKEGRYSRRVGGKQEG